MQNYLAQFSRTQPAKADIIAKLKTYGYDTSDAGTDNGYKNLIRAFQLHFRQKIMTGSLMLKQQQSSMR